MHIEETLKKNFIYSKRDNQRKILKEPRKEHGPKLNRVTPFVGIIEWWMAEYCTTRNALLYETKVSQNGIAMK